MTQPGEVTEVQIYPKLSSPEPLTIEDVRKKIKYDLLYIRKICLWTDMRILFHTVRVVLTGEGAR